MCRQIKVRSNSFIYSYFQYSVYHTYQNVYHNGSLYNIYIFQWHSGPYLGDFLSYIYIISSYIYNNHTPIVQLSTRFEGFFFLCTYYIVTNTNTFVKSHIDVCDRISMDDTTFPFPWFTISNWIKHILSTISSSYFYSNGNTRLYLY